MCSTKKGIENFLTNSLLEIRALSIDKLQGLRCKVATFDEWLSGDIREDPIGAVEQGASKNPDYLIVASSSEGTVRNGVGDSIKMELMKILRGEFRNDHVSIWYYKLDDISEVANPAMWVKANPNLGKTVSYDTYQQDVDKAEHNPSARNDILARDLAFLWKAIRTSSPTKRLSVIRIGTIGTCNARWVVTFLRVMTSAHLRSSSHYKREDLV